MNNYFWTKVDKLRTGIPVSVMDPMERVRESMIGKECRFKFRKVTEEEIKKKPYMVSKHQQPQEPTG